MFSYKELGYEYDEDGELVAPRDTRGWPVMKSMCATCPFGPSGDKELMVRVMSRTMLQASQICHSPRHHGKEETHLCRGGRDSQLQILHRMGLLEAPTDEAFEKTSRELGVI